MKGIERLISLKSVVRVNQKISIFQLRMIPKINFKRKSEIEIPDFFRYLNEIKQVKSE